MHASNIFEALASPTNENADPDTSGFKSQTSFTFEEKPQKTILGDITNIVNTIDQTPTEYIKPVAKPVIIENPTIAPAKAWEELADKENLGPKVEVTPVAEEKAQEYESLFPALGEQPAETSKTEGHFDTEILAPASLVASQTHQESSGDQSTGILGESVTSEYILSQSGMSKDVTPQGHFYSEHGKTGDKTVGIIENPTIAPAKTWDDLAQSSERLESITQPTPVIKQKIEQYESQFPALAGETTQPVETKQPEAPKEPVEDVVLNPETLMLEKVEIKEVKPEEKEITLTLNPDTLLLESDKLRVERTFEHPKPAPRPVILENPSTNPSKDWSELIQETKKTAVEAPVSEEKAQAYETHFPALGEQPKAALQPETEFNPEILASEPAFVPASVEIEAPKPKPKVARKFDQLLETEIEQLDQANLNKAGYRRYKGKDQRLKQDYDLKGMGDMEPIEENIQIEPLDPKEAKLRSSLEHLSEENVGSTQLTLSRIDLIKEELRENEQKVVERDPIFQSVQRDLDFVKECEKTKMYAESIRTLKRNLDLLDAHFIEKDNFDISEMNKLLYECNVQLAYCYSQINEIRYTIDYARAALKFNPHSTKAMYLVGGALIKAGDFVRGYDVLRQIRRIPLLPNGDVYQELIDIELKKHERRAQEVLKEIEEGTIGKKEPPSAWAGIGCFLGTALSSGTLGWFLLRNALGFSERKSLAYSIGAGTLVGGLSLVLMGHGIGK